MYCHKCGYKIVPGKNRCPHCGEDAGRAEVCGGFYGIIGKAAESEESRQKSSPQRQDSEGIKRKYEALLNAEKKNTDRKIRKGRMLLGGAALLAVIFLLFGILQSFKLSGAKKDLEEAEGRERAAIESFGQVLALQDQIEAEQKKLHKAEQVRDQLKEALVEPEEEEENLKEQKDLSPSEIWDKFIQKVTKYVSRPNWQDSPDMQVTSNPERAQAEIEKKKQQLAECEGGIESKKDEIERLEQQRKSILETLGLKETDGKE